MMCAWIIQTAIEFVTSLGRPKLATLESVGKAGCSFLSDTCSFFPFSTEPSGCIWAGGPSIGAETTDLPAFGCSFCPVFVCSLS